VLLTADDVNHAFYVPAFLFKRDAIPGLPNTFDFTVMNPGVYSGQCAEFCGVFHYAMTFTVRAVSAADFASWLSSAQASSASPSPGSAAPGASASASPVASAPPPTTPSNPSPSASPS
jgi:cytochrome c oxidase subunit 2